MNVLDLIVLLVLVLTVVRGLMRGLIDTLFSLAAWILAFLLGKWGALLAEPLLPSGLENPATRYFAGFAVVFLIVLIAVLLVGHVMAALVRVVGLGSVDKVLGGVVGVMKGFVILAGFSVAAGLTALPRTELWKQAMLSGSLQAMARAALPLLPANVATHVRFE